LAGLARFKTGRRGEGRKAKTLKAEVAGVRVHTVAKRGTDWHSIAMGVEAIEQKLAELTARVERLEKKVQPGANPTWREIIGTIPDDEISREAARLGEEWRKSESTSQ
jgi:hypothetical protein